MKTFSVIGKHLLYLTETGILNILFHSESKPLIEKSFIFKKKIMKFYERHLYLVVQNEDFSLEVFLLVDVNEHNIADTQRYRKIQNIEHVLQFALGINICYFLTVDQKVFSLDLSPFNIDSYTIQ